MSSLAHRLYDSERDAWLDTVASAEINDGALKGTKMHLQKLTQLWLERSIAIGFLAGSSWRLRSEGQGDDAVTVRSWRTGLGRLIGLPQQEPNGSRRGGKVACQVAGNCWRSC